MMNYLMFILAICLAGAGIGLVEQLRGQVAALIARVDALEGKAKAGGAG